MSLFDSQNRQHLLKHLRAVKKLDILVDFHHSMRPFRPDQIHLIKVLKQSLKSIEIRTVVFGHPMGDFRINNGERTSNYAPASGSTVLLLTTPASPFSEISDMAWSHFLERMIQAGAKVIVLSPIQTTFNQPPGILQLTWDRTSIAMPEKPKVFPGDTETIAVHRPDVYALAMLTSISPRITPNFLRAARLKLAAEACEWIKSLYPSEDSFSLAPNAESEAFLWFNDILVSGRGLEGIRLNAQTGNLMREKLKAAPGNLFKRSTAILKNYLRELPPELIWQVELMQHLTNGNVRRINQLGGELLLAFNDNSQPRLQQTLSHWARSEVLTIPELQHFQLASKLELAINQVLGPRV